MQGSFIGGRSLRVRLRRLRMTTYLVCSRGLRSSIVLRSAKDQMGVSTRTGIFRNAFFGARLCNRIQDGSRLSRRLPECGVACGVLHTRQAQPLPLPSWSCDGPRGGLLSIRLSSRARLAARLDHYTFGCAMEAGAGSASPLSPVER